MQIKSEVQNATIFIVKSTFNAKFYFLSQWGMFVLSVSRKVRSKKDASVILEGQ